jgi:hypothetical protein
VQSSCKDDREPGMLSLQGMELICRVKNELKCLERQRLDSEGLNNQDRIKVGPEGQDVPLIFGNEMGSWKTCSSCKLPRKFRGRLLVSGGPASSLLEVGCYGNLLKLRKFLDALIGQFRLGCAMT